MSSSIRRMLWGAFAALALFVAAGVGVTTAVLQLEKRQEFRILEESRPLMDAVRQMDEDLLTMVSSARGFVLTEQTQFVESYDNAVRSFQKSGALTGDLALDKSKSITGQKFIANVRDAFSKMIASSGTLKTAAR